MSAGHIVQIFRRVLDTSEVNPHSDFFELGGDSLLATRVLSAIARDLGTELSWDDFIDNPSAAGLSAKVTAGVA
jgi:acyl carrier protein